MLRRTFIAAFALLVAATSVPAGARADDVVVFAAASLKDALDAINADWQKASGKHATISYAASSALAKQIEAGAPADVFISADLDWMNYVEERKLIVPGTRHNLLGNSLVLIAPAENKPAPVDIKPDFPLAKMLDGGKLAMADPNSVPAGKYGKAALTKLGVWDSVSGSVAAAENVRACLLLVARGEAPFGIVYKTDAAIEPKVKIVGTFPADSVPAITYPIAQTAASKNADAAAFMTYLRGPDATKQFEHFGFTVLAPAK
ncbi:MAG TPA: molybdate ABC transporter substrate-binding protein [Stellaceae bacterium]|jgi:molybdate transport system substrate-binding protein|nr:molybdate ABC transporter substrate-binding protein [Stellaceae bacterium]